MDWVVSPYLIAWVLPSISGVFPKHLKLSFPSTSSPPWILGNIVVQSFSMLIKIPGSVPESYDINHKDTSLQSFIAQVMLRGLSVQMTLTGDFRFILWDLDIRPTLHCLCSLLCSWRRCPRPVQHDIAGAVHAVRRIVQRKKSLEKSG